MKIDDKICKVCEANLTASLTCASSFSFTRSVLLIMVMSARAICLKRQETQQCVCPASMNTLFKISKTPTTEKSTPRTPPKHEWITKIAKPKTPNFLTVSMCVHGWRRTVSNSNGSWALFSLEVKTQTKKKNAKGLLSVLTVRQAGGNLFWIGVLWARRLLKIESFTTNQPHEMLKITT